MKKKSLALALVILFSPVNSAFAEVETGIPAQFFCESKPLIDIGEQIWQKAVSLSDIAVVNKYAGNIPNTATFPNGVRANLDGKRRTSSLGVDFINNLNYIDSYIGAFKTYVTQERSRIQGFINANEKIMTPQAKSTGTLVIAGLDEIDRLYDQALTLAKRYKSCLTPVKTDIPPKFR